MLCPSWPASYWSRRVTCPWKRLYTYRILLYVFLRFLICFFLIFLLSQNGLKNLMMFHLKDKFLFQDFSFPPPVSAVLSTTGRVMSGNIGKQTYSSKIFLFVFSKLCPAPTVFPNSDLKVNVPNSAFQKFFLLLLLQHQCWTLLQKNIFKLWSTSFIPNSDPKKPMCHLSFGHLSASCSIAILSISTILLNFSITSNLVKSFDPHITHPSPHFVVTSHSF